MIIFWRVDYYYLDMKGLILLGGKGHSQRACQSQRTYPLCQFQAIIVPVVKSNQKYSEVVQTMCQNLNRDKTLFYSARVQNKIKVLLFYMLRIEMQVHKQKQIKMQTIRLKQTIEQKSQQIRKKKAEMNKAKAIIYKLNHQSFYMSANIRKIKSSIKAQRSLGNRNQIGSQRYSFFNQPKIASVNQQYPNFCQRKIKEIKDAKQNGILYKKRSISTQLQDSHASFTPSVSRTRYDQQMTNLSFPNHNASCGNHNVSCGFSHYNHPISQYPINHYSCIPFARNNIGCFCNLRQNCSSNNPYVGCRNTINMKRINPQMYEPKNCHIQHNTPSFACFNQQKNTKAECSKCQRQNSSIFQEKQNLKSNCQKQKINQQYNQSQVESSIADIDEHTDEKQSSNDQSTKKIQKSDNEKQAGDIPSIYVNSSLQKREFIEKGNSEQQ